MSLISPKVKATSPLYQDYQRISTSNQEKRSVSLRRRKVNITIAKVKARIVKKVSVEAGVKVKSR